MTLKDIRRIDYVVLLCSRLDAMEAFCCDVMGFAVDVERDSWTTFCVGGQTLALCPRGRGPVGAHGKIDAGAAAVQLAFRVPPSALEWCQAELTAKGIAVDKPLCEIASWRHRALFVRAPDGNIRELYADV